MKQICFPNYSASLANICCLCCAVPVNTLNFQLFLVLFLAKIAEILLGNKTLFPKTFPQNLNYYQCTKLVLHRNMVLSNFPLTFVLDL